MANILVRTAERYSTRAQSRIVDRLRKGGATGPDTAFRFIATGKAEKRLLARMVTFGAVVERDGHHWLDEAALAHFRKEELARVLGAVAVAGFAAAGAIAFGR